MGVLGPKGVALTGGWCRPFESARLGVPQIGFGALGGLGPIVGTAAQPQAVIRICQLTFSPLAD